MKFFSAVLSAFLTAAAVDAKRELAGQKVNGNKLMRSAVRVDPKTLRRLNDQDEAEAFELTAAHSIRFSKCTSLVTESTNDDIMFGYALEATQNRQVIAEKSYVLFEVCETEYCSYYGEDDATYMVDLETYMGALIEYLPTQRANYCAACVEDQDWCQ
jgi:hypothetical protein